MKRKLRLKRSIVQGIKEGLIALTILLVLFSMFLRILFFGYPSDLESGFVLGVLMTAFVVYAHTFMGGKSNE